MKCLLFMDKSSNSLSLRSPSPHYQSPFCHHQSHSVITSPISVIAGPISVIAGPISVIAGSNRQSLPTPVPSGRCRGWRSARGIQSACGGSTLASSPPSPSSSSCASQFRQFRYRQDEKCAQGAFLTPPLCTLICFTVRTRRIPVHWGTRK